MRVETEEGLCFDVGSLGDKARLLQGLHHDYSEVLGDPVKNGGHNFQEGFGHYTVQNMGKSEWESSRILDSNGLDI